MSQATKKSPLKGLGAALTTLTILPWPRQESEDLSLSLPWFPIIGLLVGLILYGISLLWSLIPFADWPGGLALIMVASGIYLTRGLHLDGLADWADSIGGFHQREKRLSIMKDVSVGAFGVLALFVVLLAKWIAFQRLWSAGALVWVPVICMISRSMMVELICTLPYARSEDGMAGPFTKGASPRHRFLAQGACLALCLPFGPLVLLFLFFAWLQTRLFGSHIRNEFGGVTGDLLGTANEMVEVSLLMICALPGETIVCYTGWTWVFG